MSRASGLSPADKNRLGWACKPIRDAFDAYPYLVGSALDSSDYRDIDIRLILDDDDFCRMFAGRGDGMARLRLVNTALSALIQQTSGLPKPIDFQIQPQSYANEEHSKPRNPLGMSGNRGGFDAPDWSASPTPTGPEPATCEHCPHGWTRAHCGSCHDDVYGPGPATPDEPTEPAKESVLDLMKALRASVEAAKARRLAAPEPTEETPTDWSYRCGECRSATICDAQRRCAGPGGADPKEPCDG